MHESIKVDDLDTAQEPRQHPSRRMSGRTIAVLAIVGVAVAALLAWMVFGGADEPAPAAADGGGEGPSVSVMVPGLDSVVANVRVTGSVAARRDLPVGLQGQGGMVVAVLVDEGDYVRRGQVLARVDRSVQSQQVAQLRASVVQADADAALAQSELDRAAALVERGFISTADIERRTASRDSARARVNVARAQLRAAEAQLAQLDVRAPEAGLVIERRVEKGQVVSSGSGALFRIAQGGEMELRAEVAEQDLAALSVGQAAQVSLVGSPVSYRGEVWMVEPIIDSTSRQGTARILIRGDRQVRPGAFATGTIETGSATRPVLPESAVLGGGDTAHVYIVGPDNTAVRRSIRIGAVTVDGVVVAEGLEGTEQVVMSAGAFLNPGEKIRPTLVEPEA
ncbi:efflux RND transporter periplasmic adaptor subunit [Pacificimonas sp. WHA3]|uniref:Efflux RND transporter periplasmic adaptor subunit n=1 Tax=Pacificimonas pallii TaxID=2827236 RepID=A0ABS6SC20_9SPHN|nr:efflux RND transporter periplasmic adaptor subunit [Pacificimonas pallii]MBV7255973.1 efflux RND transporter periplasmic adaptor subunit [Pacificimonas pallii]